MRGSRSANSLGYRCIIQAAKKFADLAQRFASGLPNHSHRWDDSSIHECNQIRILVALSGGNRFVRPLLTASSVIAVMPVSMQMVPNPGCRDEWPVHSDGGIHDVRPFNFGAWLAVVMAFAIAPHIPRKKKKPAEQHH
jgi:hypothetical protein